MDFDSHENIKIRYYSDNWGPFSFDLTDAIPSGSTLTSVSVKAYLGKVRPADDLSSETEITSSVIDADYTPQIIDSVKVSVKFKYSATYKDQKATIIFEVTTSTGAKHPIYFHSVDVE